MDKNQQRIHADFVRFGGLAKEWTGKCVLLLPEIEKAQIWKSKGFKSIYEYAAKLAGMNHEKVNDALRILAKIEDKPALRKVVELKGLGAVRPVAVVATAETDSFWAEKATEMSKNTLETYVKEYKKFCPRTESEKVDGGQISLELAEEAKMKKRLVAMEIDVVLLEKLEKLKGEASWNELMSKLLAERDENLEKQKPEVKKNASRYIPAQIKKFVIKKTYGGCAFPGCRKKFESIHHVERFALEKTHDAAQMYGLCKEHERIAHHGLIENEGKDASEWKVKLLADKGMEAYRIDRMVMGYRAKRFSSTIPLPWHGF
jgi:hypothetical protein